MGKLTPDDLRRPANSGPFAGKKRIDIIHTKVDKKRPFVINTKNGPKVTGNEYDERKQVLLGYRRNPAQIEEIRRSQIWMDEDLGGGTGGSGGGTEMTAFAESLQCYYCSYVFNVKKGNCTSVSYDQLKSASRWCYTDRSLFQALKKGPSDWVETDVYIKIANRLWNEYGTKFKGQTYWHRNSKFMQSIYQAKKTVHKRDRSEMRPQAPGSFSDDKWNPGDIWVTTFGPTTKPLNRYTSSWGELNDAIFHLGDEGKLMGISLKKVGAGQSHARLKRFNTPNAREQDKLYKFISAGFGQTGDFFNSQDIYIKTNVGEVQFRTAMVIKNWRGEIKGRTSAGGNIGGGNVNFYCEQVFGKHNGIYYKFNSEVAYLNWVNRASADGQFQNRLWDLYKKWNNRMNPQQRMMEKDEFFTKLAKKGERFRNSKAICMEFLDVLMSGSQQQRHELITKLYRYAQSDVDQSSFFVKLY